VKIAGQATTQLWLNQFEHGLDLGNLGRRNLNVKLNAIHCHGVSSVQTILPLALCALLCLMTVDKVTVQSPKHSRLKAHQLCWSDSGLASNTGNHPVQ
jgi:hypothetical protein